MNLDDLEFKTVVLSKKPSSVYINIRERKGTFIIGLSVGAQELCNEIKNNYNAIEFLVANDRVFAIKPIIKPKGNSQKQFPATVLRDNLKNIRFNQRLIVVKHKGMIVCDLDKNLI